MILHKESPDEGEITVAKGTTIGFLSQEIFRTNKDRTVLEEMMTTLPQVTATMHRLDEIATRIDQADPDSAHLLDEQEQLIDRLVLHNGYQTYDLQQTILNHF